MNTPIDDLTLALIARRTPHRTLYAVSRRAGGSMFVQHAHCCAKERVDNENASYQYDYYTTPPGDVEEVHPDSPYRTRCIVCRGELEPES